MELFRITKSLEFAKDLSGTGAYKAGGRWNSEKVYMLYTAQNRSLALLENLAHFNTDNIPTSLFITTIKLSKPELLYKLPDTEYLDNWRSFENEYTRAIGDELMFKKQYLGIQVRSAVFPEEYNFLLNPLFPGYHDFVDVVKVDNHEIDKRLLVNKL